jgi:hypothetical protein
VNNTQQYGRTSEHKKLDFTPPTPIWVKDLITNTQEKGSTDYYDKYTTCSNTNLYVALIWQLLS